MVACPVVEMKAVTRIGRANKNRQWLKRLGRDEARRRLEVQEQEPVAAPGRSGDRKRHVERHYGEDVHGEGDAEFRKRILFVDLDLLHCTSPVCMKTTEREAWIRAVYGTKRRSLKFTTHNFSFVASSLCLHQCVYFPSKLLSDFRLACRPCKADRALSVRPSVGSGF
jgi:hypothetical protein